VNSVFPNVLIYYELNELGNVDYRSTSGPISHTHVPVTANKLLLIWYKYTIHIKLFII